ncbi:MAG: ABC transporter substrate-binding protein [Gammaproteobacteria bacterium (ex Lamellibrachia satsuma)]|nr:MAG: ABC transporter substrate-binding protein [Gammaproteobacteria bacterium (ex Lamellibrachia satsuma)]
MKLRLVAVCALMLFAAAQAHAMPGYGYPHSQPQQQQEVAPDTIVREGLTQLLKFLRTKEQRNPMQITAFLEAVIAPYFDFDYMAQWAAGAAYRNMSGGQRQAVSQQVKEMLLGTLTKRLSNYEDQDVRFYRPRRAGRNEVKVSVGILNSGGYPAKIDFRFYHADDGWKVFDVSANGTSALAYYRQHFSQQKRSRGQNPGYRG